jgi:predicted naringenin-chalcone synthase
MWKRIKGPAVLGIGTAVPPNRIDQADAAVMLDCALAGNRESARWAKRIFRQCGVETRYTCEPDLARKDRPGRYLSFPEPRKAPSTSERMEIYRRHAVPLARDAAAKALKECRLEAAEITHLITVSCTGLFLPGLDAALVRELGLSADVTRLPLLFLGCAAGLTAIRLSRDIVESRPQAKVLVVCVELCTLHIQPSIKREDLFAAAFFGDGASACVVGEPGQSGNGMFILGAARTAIWPDSSGEMTWDIGNFGFTLYLSPRIPGLIERHMPAELEGLLGGEPRPELWAIHPGGRGIVDALQNLYALSDAQTRASRTILRKYGNLSSATLLFVLQEMRRELDAAGQGLKPGVALAFGPGLHAELMQIVYLPPAGFREEV